MVKRVVNLRPLFVALIFLILGIVCYANIFLSGNVTVLNIYYYLFIAILLLLGFLLPFAFLKTNDSDGNLLVRHKGTILTAFVFLLSGFFLMQSTVSYYNVSYKDFSGVYSVIGEIEDNYYEVNGVTIITLNNVVATNNEGEFRLPSRSKIMLFGVGMVSENQVNAANSIEITATITKTPFNLSGYNFSAYYNNHIYELKSVDNSFSFFKTGLDLDELIRQNYKQVLIDNTSHDMGSLSFSLLFGNDEVLGSDIKDLFTTTGVVHIISVSGLHVAVLAGAVLLLLNKLKLNKKAQLFVLTVVLVFYCYLCGFSSTVIRSAIMFVILLSAGVLGEQYDTLSSLSFSGLVLLLISPIWLFSLGFQLSFLSMFAIITLAPMFSKVLQKTKLPKGLAMSVAITIAVTIVTMPLIAHYFNQVSVYSVLSNLIAVPIMSAAYVAIFAISTLAIFVSGVGVLLVVPSIALHFSKIVLMIIGSLPASSVNILSDGYLTLLAILLLAFVVKFLMVKNSYKIIISSVLSFLVVFGFVVSNIPATYNYYSVMASAQKRGDAVVVSTDIGENVLVASYFNNTELEKTLLKPNKINKISAAIIYSYNHATLLELLELSQNYGISTFYFYNSNNNAQTEFLQAQALFSGAEFLSLGSGINYNGVSFSVVFSDDNALGINISVNNGTMLAIKGSAVRSDYLKLSYLPHKFYDFVITPQNLDLENYNIKTNAVVVLGQYVGKVLQNYNLLELSNFTIKL